MTHGAGTGVLELGNTVSEECMDVANSNHLLVITLSLLGQKAQCLIDSGASHNFVSDDYVRRAEVVTTEREA